MKRYLIIALILAGCSAEQETTVNNNSDNDQDVIGIDCDFVPADVSEPVCPEGHTDSIVPIVYGYPSEELFNQSDSGLVMLGGCEVTDCDPNWWCKKHGKGF